MYKLDAEESDILDAFASGRLKSSEETASLQKRHRESAQAMFKKDARLNIRIPTKDLRSLQKKAIAEGVPYYTLAASILHKYVEGRLCEK